MKKQWMLAAVASVCCVPYAMAQSSVTLYGSLGSSIAYVSNEHGGKAVFMGGGTTPEWIGITGAEDLGGGLKAIFKLENGINTATGAGLVSGDMFGRQAWVGLLSADYGKITLGRQFDITNEMIMPLTNGYQTSIYQLYHPANLDNFGSTFYNNAVKYTSVMWHGLTVEGMYGFDDTTTQPGRYAGAGVSYTNGRLRAAVVYSSQHDRTLALGTQLGFTEFAGERLPPAGTIVARSVQILAGNVLYDLNNAWQVRGGYSQVWVEAQNGVTETMRTGEAGANLRTSPENLISTGTYYSTFASAHYVAAGLSDVYSLSKRTALFASVVYQHASGSVAAMALLSPSSTTSQLAAYAGMQLFF
jgi:predicted porin